MPTTRRDFLRRSAAASTLAALPLGVPVPEEASARPASGTAPVVIATWNNARAAAAAWASLAAEGSALDAAEAAARVPEADPNDTSVGLGGRPDASGTVTLDACVMDWAHRCGAVAALEDILHPVSVARRVMEQTPHVLLVGAGARAFAVEQGFEPTDLLTPRAREAWERWVERQPPDDRVNVERRDARDEGHDTIGVLALDGAGRLAGACTTSGWGYKLPGRVGDSPIIGAGLYVDGEVGAATATGHGEEMVRTAAAHTVVEAMRHGLDPQAACRLAVERIARVTPNDPADMQAGMLALTPDGRVGGFALQPGFNYVVTLPAGAPEPSGTVTARTPVPEPEVGASPGTTYLVEAATLLG